MLSSVLYKVIEFLTAMLCTAVLINGCTCPHQKETIVNIYGIDKNHPVFLKKIDTGFITTIDSLLKPHTDQVEFSLSIENQGVYIIQNKDKNIEFIVLPNDTINLILTNNNQAFENSDSLNVNLEQFTRLLRRIEKSSDSLAYLFVNAQPTDSFSFVRDRVAFSFDKLLRKANIAAKSYISLNPSSIGIFMALNSVVKQSPIFNYAIDYEWFYMTDSLLKQYHPGHPYGIWMTNRIKYYRNSLGDEILNNGLLDEGFRINEITLPGTNSSLMEVKPLKGGITLLYLWDNKVGNRISNRKIRLISEKYSDKNFKLYTIAFNADINRWLSVIELDKLWGMNMVDTTAENSIILKNLNNPPLPSYILIDQNYSVVAHFGNIAQLEEWLSQYFIKGETNNQLN